MLRGHNSTSSGRLVPFCFFCIVCFYSDDHLVPYFILGGKVKGLSVAYKDIEHLELFPLLPSLLTPCLFHCFSQGGILAPQAGFPLGTWLDLAGLTLDIFLLPLRLCSHVTSLVLVTISTLFFVTEVTLQLAM